MILSEFAGAAHSLNGSIVVNPWDSQEVADSIFQAVSMDTETRKENHRKLFKVRSPPSHIYHAIHAHKSPQYVTKYSAAYWGTSFVREMTKIKTPESESAAAQKGGQAELKLKREDAKGLNVVEGAVPMTPPINAPAPNTSQ